VENLSANLRSKLKHLNSLFENRPSILKNILFLLFFHSLCLFCLTYPWLLSFPKNLMGDMHDGLQNYWNIWWVNYALRELGQSPWYSYFQFFPAGGPLVIHTLSIANTLPAVILNDFLPTMQIYNLIVLLSFVLTGIGVGLLIRSFKAGIIAQCIGSFSFTYCAYRFAHAQGHINLITTQWIPFFLLSWKHLIQAPSIKRAILASSLFMLVFFSDYYYAVYTAMIAVPFALPYVLIKSAVFQKRLLLTLGVFSVVTCAWALPFAAKLISISKAGIAQTHTAADFSLDLCSPFIPGAYWIFASHTKSIWNLYKAGTFEGSGYLGAALCIFALIGLINGRNSRLERIVIFGIGVVFLIFSFGPILQVHGKGIWPYMPYRLLEFLVPILKVGGIPARMVIISSLMFAVIAGIGAESLRGKLRIVTLALSVIMVIESIPRLLPSFKLEAPELVQMMQKLPHDFAVMDINNTTPSSIGLYWQTIYQMPKWNGYLSRVPKYVEKETVRVAEMARDSRWQELCEKEGFRYLLFQKSDPIPPLIQEHAPIMQDQKLVLYDLGLQWPCLEWRKRAGVLN
jgi:hypothetical protein